MGIAVGIISSRALSVFGYPYGFAVPFGLAVILLIAATYSGKHVRELPELAQESTESSVSPLVSLKKICRMREFKLLAPPNILRGLGDGASFFVMAVGMRKLGIGVEYAGYTTALIFLGLIAGTSFLGVTVDRYGAGSVLLIAEIFIAAALMGLVRTHSPLIYLAFFLLLQTFANVEAYTVPLAHYAIVPASVIGAFFGVRLMILFITTAVTTQIAGLLLQHKEYFIHVFAVCAVLKIVTGMLFWYAINKHKRDEHLYAAGTP